MLPVLALVVVVGVLGLGLHATVDVARAPVAEVAYHRGLVDLHARAALRLFTLHLPPLCLRIHQLVVAAVAAKHVTSVRVLNNEPKLN